MCVHCTQYIRLSQSQIRMIAKSRCQCTLFIMQKHSHCDSISSDFALLLHSFYCACCVSVSGFCFTCLCCLSLSNTTHTKIWLHTFRLKIYTFIFKCSIVLFDNSMCSALSFRNIYFARSFCSLRFVSKTV